MLQIVAKNVYVPEEAAFLRWLDSLAQWCTVEPEMLTVRVVDTDEGQQLNQQYRGKDTPTNVLSFPSQLPEFVEPDYLGDLVICAAVVNREALEQNKAVDAHWAHMLVHGVLHLLGYDHMEEAQAEEMEALESKIVIAMGYTTPYFDSNAE